MIQLLLNLKLSRWMQNSYFIGISKLYKFFTCILSYAQKLTLASNSCQSAVPWCQIRTIWDRHRQYCQRWMDLLGWPWLGSGILVLQKVSESFWTQINILLSFATYWCKEYLHQFWRRVVPMSGFLSDKGLPPFQTWHNSCHFRHRKSIHPNANNVFFVIICYFCLVFCYLFFIDSVPF